MGGGAWPFLVGGAICLVNSDNERDSSLLNRRGIDLSVLSALLLRGTSGVPSHAKLSNNRSVMPLDVRGRTRATMRDAVCPQSLTRKGWVIISISLVIGIEHCNYCS